MTQNQIRALVIDKATATDKISDKISTLVIETDKVHGIPKATTLSGIVYEKEKTGTNHIQFL